MKRLAKTATPLHEHGADASNRRRLSDAVFAHFGASLLAMSLVASVALADTAAAAPTASGMSSTRLDTLDRVFDAALDQGGLQGAVLVVKRDGQEVLKRAYGHLDGARQRDMPTDAVFDLSTLTQPITAAAAMSWQEQGGWVLSDDLGRYLTPFARRQASLWDVIRQTDGFASAIDPLNLEAGQPVKPSERWRHSLTAAMNMTADSFVQQIAGQASLFAPGEVAKPGFSFDLLGLALEASSQQTLGTFFLRHLFIPLDMWDTGFNPAAGLETRLVSRDGGPVSVAPASPVRDPRDPVIFECGGACLTGTAGDYSRFAGMLLNSGRIGSQQVLSRLSVGMMKRHQLEIGIDNRLPALVRSLPSRTARERSGLGLALMPADTPSPLPLQAGDFGAWSTSGSFFWASPTERLVVVMLAVQPDQRQSARLREQVIGLIAHSIVE